jgi:hypothetical protein
MKAPLIASNCRMSSIIEDQCKLILDMQCSRPRAFPKPRTMPEQSQCPCSGASPCLMIMPWAWLRVSSEHPKCHALAQPRLSTARVAPNAESECTPFRSSQREAAGTPHADGYAEDSSRRKSNHEKSQPCCGSDVHARYFPDRASSRRGTEDLKPEGRLIDLILTNRVVPASCRTRRGQSA